MRIVKQIPDMRQLWLPDRACLFPRFSSYHQKKPVNL